MRPVSRRRSGAPPAMGRASAQRVGGTEHNLLGVMVAFAAWLMPSARGPPHWLV
jgi:hypothetical protein